MATGITVSTTDDLEAGQAILIKNAVLAFEPAAPDPDLVTQDELPAGHKQRDIITMSRLSQANAATEGVDVSQVEALQTNLLQITPSEHVVIVTISNVALKRQGDQNLEATAGTQMGQSARIRMANDIIALYDGFSKSVGAAGTTLDITHIRGAFAYLRTDNNSAYGPAPLPINAALHIEHISDIVDQITDQSPRGTTTGITERVLQQWWTGTLKLYRIAMFESGNMSADGADDAKGGLFNPGALVLVTEPVGSDEIETEKDISHRVTEYVLAKSWGEGERADPHGVEMYFDAATTV